MLATLFRFCQKSPDLKRESMVLDKHIAVRDLSYISFQGFGRSTVANLVQINENTTNTIIDEARCNRTYLMEPNKPLIMKYLNISISTNVRYFSCEYFKISQFPDLPNLEVLKLGWNDLDYIPDLPNCRSFTSSGNKIQNLPKMPKCAHIICVSSLISEISELGECVTLSCEDSSRLKKISNLPKCKQINCSRSAVEILDNIPECIILLCFITKLVSIPELPKCRKLICPYNGRLTSLPDLPSCIELDKRHTQISDLPKLAENCTIRSKIELQDFE